MTWIGVEYTLNQDDFAEMALPSDFLKELDAQLEPLVLGSGSIGLRDLDRIIGRAGRVAFIVPEARPFAAALWAGLSAARAAHRDGVREAPPGRAAVRRFATAARWFRALIRGGHDAPFRLVREVGPKQRPLGPESGYIIVSDASTDGYGFALLLNGKPVEYAYGQWADGDVAHLPVTKNNPRYQTFWEMAALLMALVLWGHLAQSQTVGLVGDNSASLQNLLDLKGKPMLLPLAREAAWRQAVHRWQIVAGHLPTEANGLADSLSRQHGAKRKAFPQRLLGTACRIDAVQLAEIWSV